VGIFLLRTIVANNPSIGDVPASCLGYVLLCHEGNGLGGCHKALDFLSKRLAPYVFVFWMFQQMAIFQKVHSLVIKYCCREVQRNWRGNLRDVACWVVKGCVGVGTSIMWNRKSSVMVLPLRWWCVLAEGGLTDS
jgi:hypothetical protein